MSRVCEICGRGPQVGNNVSHAHNVTKRRFNINIQTMRVLIDGTPRRIKVCTRCIQAGKIVRPQFELRERKPKKKVDIEEIKIAAAAAMEEEPVSEFFSSDSIVDVIFKKKRPLPGITDEEEQALEEAAEEAKASEEPVEEESEVQRELKTAFIDPEEIEEKKEETGDNEEPAKEE